MGGGTQKEFYLGDPRITCMAKALLKEYFKKDEPKIKDFK